MSGLLGGVRAIVAYLEKYLIFRDIRVSLLNSGTARVYFVLIRKAAEFVEPRPITCCVSACLSKIYHVISGNLSAIPHQKYPNILMHILRC